MKTTPLQQFSAARRRYQLAQENCVHWDYENGEGLGYDCCHEMNEACEQVRAAKRRLDRQCVGSTTTTCIEHAYGTTERLSFQIKVF